MPASEHASPQSHRDDALVVVRTLVEAGHVAYFAGGCVRDMLFGREPKDFDVATDAPPDRVRSLFKRSQGVGAAFGVVIVRIGRSQIEVATFRSDGPYSDGRRPDEVRFASAEEDARRRDFTVNGVFFDPLTDRVIDYVGGQADLATRTLRAIGDPQQRFAEDYLRMLRAVRFAARFDLTIDPATADAIRANAAKLPRIAPERIGDELRAMLTPPTRVRAVRLLDETGLTRILFRQFHSDAPQPTPTAVRSDAGADAPIRVQPHAPSDPTAQRSAFDASLIETLSADRSIAFPLALVAFTFDALARAGESLPTLLTPAFATKLERAFRQSLRLSNDEFDNLRVILSAAALLPPHESPGVARLKRFLARPFAADAHAFLRTLAAIGFATDRIATVEATISSFDPTTIAPPPLVTGDDLVALGFAPGPRFKTALDSAYDAQLESRIATRDEAIALARSLMA